MAMVLPVSSAPDKPCEYVLINQVDLLAYLIKIAVRIDKHNKQ